MPSLGQTLRRAREQQSRSLSELANETCITSRYLAAIEADNLKVVPGEFFYRNFVKQYAKALHLDPDECARQADALLPHEELEPLVEATPSPASTRQIEVPRLTASAAMRLLMRRMIPVKPLPPRLLVGAIIVCCVIALNALIVLRQPLTPGGAADTRASQPQSPQAIPDSAPVEVSTPEAAPATDPDTVRVKVAATEPAWVSISSAGKTLFRGRLEPDEERDFETQASAKIWTHNAAALDIEWNGKTIGPIGSRGEVALVLFTPERYEILEPRGM